MKFKCPFAATIAAAHAGILANPAGYFNDQGKVHLCKNNIAIGAGTVIADFVEADFAGYVPKENASNIEKGWSLFLALLVFRCQQAEFGVVFQPSGLVAPQTVNGVYVTTADDTKLLGAAMFANPYIFQSDEDFIDLGTVEWALGDGPFDNS